MTNAGMTDEEDEGVTLDRCCQGISRREILRLALLGAGAWAVEPIVTLAARTASSAEGGGASLPRAAELLRDLITRHAKATDDPWAMMHGIRALGKGFSVAGGSALEYLCSHQLQEKELGGGTYLFMPGQAEGHSDTFLKTLLEAGVGLDQPITAVGRRRTVADLLHDAKQLFTYDPTRIDGKADDLSWSIIAFAITSPPSQDRWRNAQQQEIRLREVIAYAFATAESASADFHKAMTEGRTPPVKDRISDFTCGGTHLLYSLGVAVRYGHLGEEGRRRFADQLALLIWRMKIDPILQDQYYERLAKAYPGREEGLRPYRLDGRLKFLGHAFEILSYNRLFRLVPLTAEQERLERAAGQALAKTITEVATLDLAPIKTQKRKLFDLLVGDACHAYHGIHMVKGLNQV
jgi:hypothetical protein